MNHELQQPLQFCKALTNNVALPTGPLNQKKLIFVRNIHIYIYIYVLIWGVRVLMIFHSASLNNEVYLSCTTAAHKLLHFLHASIPTS